MAADPQKLKRRFEQMVSARGTLNAHCEEIAQFIMPGAVGFQGPQTPGDKRMTKIYDSTGVQSLEMLAAGLHGMASNPASRWFGLRMVELGFEEDDEVKKYLSDTEQTMRAYMYAPGTNLITALHETYLELGAFGTAVMFIGERSDGGLLYQSRPLAECFIAENADGKVDTLYRKTLMTARQIVMQWPATASPDVRKKMEKEPDEKIEICHSVEPRGTREYDKKNRDNMPFASCYFETKTCTLLEESGFPEFPYAVDRWSKRSSEEYGRGPAMIALPDVKMLQEMMKTTLTAAQLQTMPPINVPDEGMVGPVRQIPGGFNYYRGERKPEPWNIGANLPTTLEMMNELRARIRVTFFADLMQMPDNVDMTAFEYSQRVAERMRLLGPVIGRLESEKLGPTITRTFDILNRKGVLPEPPEQIAGREFTVEFVSPIAMAQKQTEGNVLGQTLLQMGELPKFFPEMFDRLRKQEVLPYLWDLNGGDPDLMIGDKEWEGVQAQQQMQQSAMMAAQAAVPVADAANKGAGAVDKLAAAQMKGADVAGMMAQLQGRAA